ncbi:kinetochore protein Spc25 [Cynoglossus semilaevis]|uniref:Kinetochore protein SPC25 n=1 Tax=Cynoglossus semilaevis TaxID=244447 RepID=A0A3P8VY10_CYNSE|nr:kinetochore protein Spc25 [Cynoglossus semilaevis]
MTSITDPNTSVRFTNAMEEIHNKLLQTCGELVDTTTELSQAESQFLKFAHDTYLKKCKDDEMLFETIQAFKKVLKQKNVLLKEKSHDISEVVSVIQQKEMQKNDIMLKIEKLTEEQGRRKELIEAQNRANKTRLRNLQKARGVFQEHLGLEIRTIFGKGQLMKGDYLQFVFRNIDPKNQDSAYIVVMGIKEDGCYQIVSSDPVLDLLPTLERRLQETNNMAAFLANVRKEFVSHARG